jgi:hypothetical protein
VAGLQKPTPVPPVFDFPRRPSRRCSFDRFPFCRAQDAIIRKGVVSRVKRIPGKTLALGLFLIMAPVFAADKTNDKLDGMWQMVYQKFAGTKVAPDPVAIRITEVSGALKFEYLMKRELKLIRQFVVRPDGEPVPVTDGNGNQVGRAKLTKESNLAYKLSLQRPGSPPEEGTMALTDGGMTLTCESDVRVSGRMGHLIQVYGRQTAEP